jgi:hypothetical protein
MDAQGPARFGLAKWLALILIPDVCRFNRPIFTPQMGPVFPQMGPTTVS